MKLEFNKTAIATMKSWLEEHYPHEACGFFTGDETDGGRVITDLWPVENVSTENLRRRFVIHPKDYLAAERRADESGKALLGVFHSHPDHPAKPSEHDLASAQPYFSYVIANVQEGTMGDVRSYRLDKDRFVEETVIINSK